MWKTLFPFLLMMLPTTAFAHHILLYHNSLDGSGGTLLKCAAILRDAGHTVTVRDVRGRSYDPTRDNWGDPYDQVWDLRFVNEDHTRCGSGDPSSPDFFTPRWRSKAVSFLSNCGRLFLAGENYQLTHRCEGLYRFLREVGAVRAGFQSCGPSRRGNNITEGPAFYPVRKGFGPVSFFGALVGGIPVESLTGTSYVETFVGWEGDNVNRSIAAGWKGDQLGGLVTDPDCAKGRLFMVWEASMWPLLYKEGVAAEWDIDRSAGRDLTRRFFRAIAEWLGSPDCPCRPGPEPTVLPTPVSVLVRPSPTALPRPASPAPPASTDRPQTLSFQAPPVNVRVRFLDGPGVYRLEVLDKGGRSLRVLFDRTIVAQKETWASWDGLDAWGRLRGPGTYYAQLSREGRPIRRIVLDWAGP